MPTIAILEFFNQLPSAEMDPGMSQSMTHKDIGLRIHFQIKIFRSIGIFEVPTALGFFKKRSSYFIDRFGLI